MFVSEMWQERITSTERKMDVEYLYFAGMEESNFRYCKMGFFGEQNSVPEMFSCYSCVGM